MESVRAGAVAATYIRQISATKGWGYEQFLRFKKDILLTESVGKKITYLKYRVAELSKSIEP